MLLRDGARASSFEVLMLRRSAQSTFAPDVYAFPGGAVEHSDYNGRAGSRIAGLGAHRLDRMFRGQNTSLLAAPSIKAPQQTDQAALIVAALRELFEEGGILLGNASASSVKSRHIRAARERLWQRAADFVEVLDELEVTLDASNVELFSEWITPPTEPRRFHAYFFIARADRQAAAADRYETHDELWIEPGAALRGYEAGTFAMVYPTVKHIERLHAFRNIDEALEFSREKPIVRVMPDVSAASGFSLPRELEGAW